MHDGYRQNLEIERLYGGVRLNARRFDLLGMAALFIAVAVGLATMMA